MQWLIVTQDTSSLSKCNFLSILTKSSEVAALMTSINHVSNNIEIQDSQAGQRIDNFLIKHLKGVPKSHIYRILRSGEVRVNSGRKKPHYKLQPGDTLRIPPIRLAENTTAQIPKSIIDLLNDAILYEDKNLIVINKPAGIAVHKGSGLNFGVIEAFRQIRPEQSLELVHRLDRETSGCLLLAKNRHTLAQLHELLRHEKATHIEKTYFALVNGRWSQGKKTFDTGICKIKRSGEHLMQVDTEGDRAISHFEPMEIFPDCSLMKVTIETGRTHQIRVHAQYAGHAIIGDSKYGDKQANQHFRTMGLKRLFLHAARLYLPLETALTLEAPLSNDLEALLLQLR